jgi:hypothetical protein
MSNDYHEKCQESMKKKRFTNFNDMTSKKKTDSHKMKLQSHMASNELQSHRKETLS